MRVISHMSVLAPGCPQSNSHHYAFTADLCDVGDAAVSSLSALQGRKHKGGNNYKPVWSCISTCATQNDPNSN